MRRGEMGDMRERERERERERMREREGEREREATNSIFFVTCYLNVESD